jgi:hypothetical protein
MAKPVLQELSVQHKAMLRRHMIKDQYPLWTNEAKTLKLEFIKVDLEQILRLSREALIFKKNSKMLDKILSSLRHMSQCLEMILIQERVLGQLDINITTKEVAEMLTKKPNDNNSLANSTKESIPTHSNRTKPTRIQLHLKSQIGITTNTQVVLKDKDRVADNQPKWVWV